MTDPTPITGPVADAILRFVDALWSPGIRAPGVLAVVTMPHRPLGRSDQRSLGYRTARVDALTAAVEGGDHG